MNFFITPKKMSSSSKGKTKMKAIPARAFLPHMKKEIQSFQYSKIMWAPEQINSCVDATTLRWSSSVIDTHWVDIYIFLTRANAKDVEAFLNFITAPFVWPISRRSLCSAMMTFMVQLESVGLFCSQPVVDLFRWRYNPHVRFACERLNKGLEMIGPASELLRGTKRDVFLSTFKELYDKQKEKEKKGEPDSLSLSTDS